MTLILAAVLLLALALPHRLDLERASPLTAATIWGAALALRALTAVFIAAFAILYIPATRLFSAISHWCLHAVIPLVTSHLPLSGHAFGDAAVIAPSFALAASVMSMVVGLLSAARRIRTLLRRTTIGAGPRDSVVLSGGEVMVAAAGLRRPRIVVSSGALVAFDDEELEASLDHERGHIAHHHRFVLLAADLCRAAARPLPGTRRAAHELRYHLERDADEYALNLRHDPAALASAICKAARAAAAPTWQLALSGGPASRRITRLIDGAAGVTARRRVGLRLCATTLALVALGAAALVPAAVAKGMDLVGSATAISACPQS